MKTKRLAKILELIQAKPIDTQEELLKALREHGFDVTQATVSRDIKELRLVKALDGEGNYRYTAVHQDAGGVPSKFRSIFSEAVVSIDYAKNLLVIKCFSGMAQAACAAMDTMQWEGMVGTIAGDDTILAAMRSENAAISLMGELKKYTGK